MPEGAAASIGIVGDFDPARPTHARTVAALAHMPGPVEAEWVPTEVVTADRLAAYDGLFLASGDYRSSEGALGAIRFARERGVPLVAT